MSGRAVLLVVGVVSLGAAAACALVAGIDQPTDRPADAAAGSDASGSDAEASPGDAEASPGDAAKDTLEEPSPGDAAKDTLEEPSSSDGCVNQTEICTDGIDNNCDGLIDCADPMCVTAGYACVPSVPSGWTYDAVDTTDAAAPCPAGYDGGTLVASASGEAATCGCSCAVGTPPDCLTGTILASVGASSCTAGAQIAFVQADGQCATGGPTEGVPSFFGAAPLDAGGTCSATPTPSVPPKSETDWRGCSGPHGAGCSGGQVCAFAGHGFTACVVGPGDAGCPTGYSTPSTPGTGVSDTRGCSACACAAAPSGVTCDDATISFWSGTSCSGGAVATLAVDGGCQGTSGAAYGAFRYSAAAAGTASCGAPTEAPAPTGGVAVTGQVTACCIP